MDSYIQNLFADRIGGARYGKGTTIYKFEKIKRARRAALAANPGGELIDMGVGEPDEMAFPDCVAALSAAAAKPDNRGYADNGGNLFKEAAARWMASVCNVPGIDPERHVCHSIGSKSALTILPACFINPGEVALMTTPGYPVFGTHAAYYGGEVFNLPLRQERKFLPDFSEIPADKLRRAKTLVLNYPNNPTGASATPQFFAQAVEFARKNNLILIHDAAYAALVFEGKPLSILATPGAMDVAVELHSMSKAYNMTGWRLGFVVGNPLIVKAYADVKDNSDSGQFLAIQEACAYALDHPEITRKIAAKYSRRMDGLVAVLNKHGFSARKPAGSFFLYVKCPRGVDGRVKFETAEAFSQWMIAERLISTVPWDDAGAYVRFSVTFSAKDQADEKRVLDEIDRRLAGGKFEF
ncbi:MAG TPA: LL-diaminopimelate aminotransferase [Tepidisphaeraceae bacterium]|nr:LL-diaminopimelate aminotransferase [Tepidisphaeraceae bacterium]